MQREVDIGVELTRFREGSSRPLNEACAFYCHVPSLPVFYPPPVLDRARLAFVGLGSPLKFRGSYQVYRDLSCSYRGAIGFQEGLQSVHQFPSMFLKGFKRLSEGIEGL